MVDGHGFEADLVSWFSDVGRAVLAGIGNPIRKDDFAGTEIVRRLRGKVSERVSLIECETVPESFLQQIVDFNPTHVLLIDAGLTGLRPGDAKLIPPESLRSSVAYSTHALPLRIFCDYLAQATEAKIGLLVIEPKDAGFGEGLTPELEESVARIATTLLKALP